MIMLPQPVRFGLVGVTATAIHVIMLLLLVEKLALAPVLASVPSFLSALIVSYLANQRWTFLAHGNHGRHFPRYAAVSVAGLFLNIAIMYGTVSLMHMPYLIGLSIVVVVVPLISFLLQRYWAFSDPKRAALGTFNQMEKYR